MQSDMDFLEITFDTIDEGITIYDSELRLVRWNKQYGIMGITPVNQLYRGARLLDTYIDMAKAGVFGEGDPVELASKRIDALKSGPLIENEILNGSLNRLIRINRFRLSNGGICATFRDVTEERQAEMLSRQSAKLKALGNLAGGLAHDLNNVLAIVIGNLEIAQHDPLNARESTEIALAAADGGAQLVQRLLTFSRRQPQQTTVVSVSDPLDKLCSMLSTLMGKNISLRRVSGKNLWLVEIDVNQFESTILNLIINARDSMPDGGELTISVRNIVMDARTAKLSGMRPGEFVCVSIADTGVGMSASTMEQVFDPFFTTKDAKMGTGLGLSMAHGFARQSSGYISVSSEINIGTTVQLYFPRTQSTSSEIVLTPPQSQVARNMKHTVLVVEDDDALRISLGKLIRSLGCIAIVVGSAEKAIAYEKLEDIDVLLTDLSLPGINGLLLAEALLLEYPRLGVIYMSGNADSAIELHGSLKPDAVFLEKPFRRVDLSDAIESLRFKPITQTDELS